MVRISTFNDGRNSEDKYDSVTGEGNDIHIVPHISGEERQDSEVFCEEQLLQMSTILTYGKQSKNFTVSRA